MSREKLCQISSMALVVIFRTSDISYPVLAVFFIACQTRRLSRYDLLHACKVNSHHCSKNVQLQELKHNFRLLGGDDFFSLKLLARNLTTTLDVTFSLEFFICPFGCAVIRCLDPSHFLQFLQVFVILLRVCFFFYFPAEKGLWKGVKMSLKRNKICDVLETVSTRVYEACLIHASNYG